MARIVRIDHVRVGRDGSVTIEYTAGSARLPAEPSGHGRSYPSKQAIRGAIAEMNEGGPVDQVLMAFLQDMKTDPEIKPGTRSAISIFDFTNGTTING